MGVLGKSKQEIAFMKRQVPVLSKQLLESVELLDKTIKPDVFFNRYDFMIETLSRLSAMEKHIKFKNEKPSLALQKLNDPNVREAQTANFIVRAVEKLTADVEKLKTEKAKHGKIDKFYSDMKQFSEYLTPSNLMLLETLKPQI